MQFIQKSSAISTQTRKNSIGKNKQSISELAKNLMKEREESFKSRKPSSMLN